MQNLKYKKIRLLVSDIDGTLVPHNKILTEETLTVAKKLQEAGIALTLVSSRPVLGMQMFLDQLQIIMPYAALNGGEIVGEDKEILAIVHLDFDIVLGIYKILKKYPVNIWFYNRHEWLVMDNKDPLVIHEEKTIKVAAKPVTDLKGYMDGVIKIMVVSHKTHILSKIARELDEHYAGKIKAIQSSDHYLDITNPRANKGSAIEQLGRELNILPKEMAVIGDMDNDIPMFKRAGLAIAMGQSSKEVQRHANIVTKSNEENGWAYAVERYILTQG